MSETAANKTACPQCQTWVCDSCGWKRKKVPQYVTNHICSKCLFTQGTVKPTIHRKGVCNA